MILEDLVYPAEIVGKRIRIKLDGSRLIKVHLDKAQQTNIEHKVGGGRRSAAPLRSRPGPKTALGLSRRSGQFVEFCDGSGGTIVKHCG